MPGDVAASLDKWPYIQLVFAGLFALAGLGMMLQAWRDKSRAPPPAAMPEGLQMFFNGPLVSALQCLREQTAGLQQANGSLRDVVHALGNAIQMLAAIEANQRRLKEEVAAQTERHEALMRDLHDTVSEMKRLKR